jgi:hypothetical protein
MARHSILEMLDENLQPKISYRDLAMPDFTGGSCADQTEIFDGEEFMDIKAAKEICGGCPLIEACREWGMKFENHLVWGGLTPRERELRRGGGQVLTPEQHLSFLRKFELLASNLSAGEVAALIKVEERTVQRWRKSIFPERIAG